jgi:hypothetical protein
MSSTQFHDKMGRVWQISQRPDTFNWTAVCLDDGGYTTGLVSPTFCNLLDQIRGTYA